MGIDVLIDSDRLAALIEESKLLRGQNGRLLDEAIRLRSALEEISGRHIPDQPAAYDVEEIVWVKRQYGALRALARQALEQSVAYGEQAAVAEKTK